MKLFIEIWTIQESGKNLLHYFFLHFLKMYKHKSNFYTKKKNLSFNTSLEISRLGFSKFQTSSSKWEAELMFDKLFLCKNLFFPVHWVFVIPHIAICSIRKENNKQVHHSYLGFGLPNALKL